MFLVEDFHSAFNPDAFLEKLRGVMELIRRGATEGERAGAKMAFTRLMDRAKTEIVRMRQPDSGVTHTQLERFIRLLDQISQNTQAKPEQERPRRPDPRQSVPNFKVGEWVIKENGECGKITKVFNFADKGIMYVVKFVDPADEYTVQQSELRKATQEDIDAALASKPKKPYPEADDLIIYSMAHYFSARENSNKIYGVVQREDKVFTFWGGTRKSLSVKYFSDKSDAYQQYDSKIAKGYREMSASDIADAKKEWVVAALKARFAKMSET